MLRKHFSKRNTPKFQIKAANSLRPIQKMPDFEVPKHMQVPRCGGGDADLAKFNMNNGLESITEGSHRDTPASSLKTYQCTTEHCRYYPLRKKTHNSEYLQHSQIQCCRVDNADRNTFDWNVGPQSATAGSQVVCKDTPISKSPTFQSNAEHFKDQSQRKNMQDFEYRQHTGIVPSFGDEDRAEFHSNCHSNSTTGNHHQGSKNNNYLRQTNQNPVLSTITTDRNKTSHTDNSNLYLFDTDCAPSSAESNKSKKSSKTLLSKRSSKDLRKLVRSQCKLQDLIDESIGKVCNKCQDQQPKLCNEGAQTLPAQKDVMTQISEEDCHECHSSELLTISLDDIVKSKVVNPITRKLQSMYFNDIREKMSLMQDLDSLPNDVNKLYKAFFKTGKTAEYSKE